MREEYELGKLKVKRRGTLPALQDAAGEGLRERMQTPEASKGMETAFNADPAVIDQPATEAARRQR